MESTYTLDRIFRIFIFLVFAAIGIFTLQFLAEVLIPFFVAFLVAYIVNPLVEKIQRKLKNRVVAVLISLLSIIIVLFIIVFSLVPLVGNEFKEVGILLQNIWQNPEWHQKLSEYIPSELVFQLKNYLKEQDWIIWIQNKEFWSIFQKAATFVIPKAAGVFSGVINGLMALLGVIIIILYLVFMLIDYEQFRKECRSMIPTQWQKDLFEFWNQFDFYMSKYFRAQAMVAGIVGVLFALGFSFISLPMAIILGCFVGLLNMVPYLQILALPLALFLGLVQALSNGENPTLMIIGVLAIFAVVQLIQDAYLTPKFMGKVTGFSPAIILLSISFWGKILGFLGLIVAIPLTCLVFAYYQKIKTKSIDKN
jgi:predicted PurR-regulated permease PerM